VVGEERRAPSTHIKEFRDADGLLTISGRVAECRRLIGFSQVLLSSQDNVMMMQPVRIEASVAVAPKITRWPNPSMALGRIGQARRSDRTRSAGRL